MSTAISRLLRPVSRLHVIPTRVVSIRPHVAVIPMGVRSKATAAAATPAKASAKSKTAAAVEAAPKKTRAAASASVTKKTAAKKPAAAAKKTADVKKTSTAKKTAATTEKVAKKKKKVAKKPVRVLTAEEKEAKKARQNELRAAEKMRSMKALALKPPGKPNARISPFNVYISQTMATPGKSLITKEIFEAYQRLPDPEKARYDALAKAQVETRNAAYRAWIESHSAEEIAIANKARRWLQKMGVRGHHDPLVDHRKPPRPASAFLAFYKTAYESLEGSAVSEKAKAAGVKWKGMTDAEKKPYADLAHSNFERWGSDNAAYAKI